MLKQIAVGAICAFALPAMAQETTPWPKECKLSQVASLPMTMDRGHILIPISINGKPLQFILDTGGYASGLSAKAVADLGLETHAVENVIIKDVGGKTAGRYVRSESLGFGTMLGKGLPLLVMADLGAADGLLAPDLLRNFDVELDFADNKANLFHHHACKDRALYWTSAYAVMPFDIMENTHIRVSVTLDGKDTLGVLDTGAPVTSLTLDSAQSLFGLDVKSPGMEKVGQMFGGSGGSATTYSYPFKTLTMGGVTVSNPIMRVADAHNYVGSDYAKLLLGLSFLRHLRVYIAYKEGKLYLSDANAQ